MQTFAELPLIPSLRHAVDAAGYTQPTPIQSGALPFILDGHDVIAQAPTGSGKTVAFGLGILQRLDVPRAYTQALVLCPTRELADQVAKEIRRLAIGIPNVKLTLITGGVPQGPQRASLSRAPHIVVGTPGRVADLLERGVLDASGIMTVVLDEADRMLDMGFEQTLESIVALLPKARQTLLFSATWPDAIRAMAHRALADPREVVVDQAESQPEVEQWFHEVEAEAKSAALAGLLLQHRPESAVVFCNTRRDVEELAGALRAFGFASAALHGDLEQRDRDEVLVRFANRSLGVLVASDVAARGLDVKQLACVVNYELPVDPDTYRHRVGRTARAGHSGLALNLVAAREMPRALQLEALHGVPLRWVAAPLRPLTADKVSSAPMVTLRLDAGRSDKLRPGDVLGALTGTVGLPAEAIGKIDIFPKRAFVAVRRDLAEQALAGLRVGRIKGRSVRIQLIR